jgi:hypothetical protein
MSNEVVKTGEPSWLDWYKSQRQINEERQKAFEELMKLVNKNIWDKPSTNPDEGLGKLVTDGLTDSPIGKVGDYDHLTDPEAWYTNPTPCWTDLITPIDDEEDKEIDLRHERSRAYIYPAGNVTIENPTYLLFDKDGNHIVEDDKYVYEIAPGWLAIRKEY